MADRVYPSAKQNGAAANPAAATAANGAAATNPPKPQLYNPNRIPYRPTPTAYHRHDRRRCNCRRCFCLGCFWAVLIICILLLLAAIAGAIFYVLYRPQRPAFSVSSLKISQFNLTTAAADDTTRLTAKLNLTLSAKNRNKKLIYTYDRISLIAFASQVTLANGSFPGFPSDPNNITIIHSTLSLTSQVLDADSVSELKSDLKRRRGLPIKIVMDTMVVLKLEKLKSKKFGIRVTCEGIHSQTPKGKTPAMATTSNASLDMAAGNLRTIRAVDVDGKPAAGVAVAILGVRFVEAKAIQPCTATKDIQNQRRMLIWPSQVARRRTLHRRTPGFPTPAPPCTRRRMNSRSDSLRPTPTTTF